MTCLSRELYAPPTPARSLFYPHRVYPRPEDIMQTIEMQGDLPPLSPRSRGIDHDSCARLVECLTTKQRTLLRHRLTLPAFPPPPSYPSAVRTITWVPIAQRSRSYSWSPTILLPSLFWMSWHCGGRRCRCFVWNGASELRSGLDGMEECRMHAPGYVRDDFINCDWFVRAGRSGHRTTFVGSKNEYVRRGAIYSTAVRTEWRRRQPSELAAEPSHPPLV